MSLISSYASYYSCMLHVLTESKFALIIEERSTDTLRSTASSRTDDGSRMPTLQRRAQQTHGNYNRHACKQVDKYTTYMYFHSGPITESGVNYRTQNGSREPSLEAGTMRSTASSRTDEGSIPRSTLQRTHRERHQDLTNPPAIQLHDVLDLHVPGNIKILNTGSTLITSRSS